MSDRTHLDPRSTAPAQGAPPGDDVPLVVDLDGTLTPSDLLIESVFRLAPADLARLPLWLLAGKAALKERVAHAVQIGVDQLPLTTELVALITAERQRGRKVYLASASDHGPVRRLADALGLFDGVFASDGATNLKGADKERALVQAFGPRGFDYAGDDEADLAVWRSARRAIVVNAPPRLAQRARQVCPEVTELAPRRLDALVLLRAARAHQWLKNLLVFLPALADHSLDAATLGVSVLAFVAFCLCASSVYLLNDLADLPADRAHPTKRERPFASGRVPLAHGLAAIPLLLAAAGLVSLALPWAFAAVLAGYWAVTLLYTLTLKRLLVMDVLALAGLYTLRVIAGAAATGIVVSEWLLAFSMFLFLCLALIKRYSELIQRRGKAAGRAYVSDDTPMVAALAGASGFVSVLVLALYIASPDVDRLYRHPEWLWGIGILLLYWISRMLMLAHRGEVHDDPVVFAVKDRASLLVVALAGAIAALAATP